jgi:lipopolysaccharide transport system permease protein
VLGAQAAPPHETAATAAIGPGGPTATVTRVNPVDAAATGPEILIGPPKRWRAIDVRELWGHRELIYFLTKRELQVRYKQSIFGVSWAILQPLTYAFVFALFFGRIVHVSSEGIPYPVFAVIGLVPWLFTANAVQNSAMSLVQDSDLLSKVYFPRLALPISKALSLVIDLAIAMVVVIIVTLIYGVSIQSTIILVPFFLLLALVTAFALGTLFSALNVKYRDVSVVIPMVVQIGFFITPVLYPGSFVSGSWQYVWALNPMVSAIDGIRWALVGTPPPLVGQVVISTASALVMLLIALRYFQRAEQWFADVI